MESEVAKLLEQNTTLRYNINLVGGQIDVMRDTIRKNESKIYKLCKHEWVYDTGAGPYERIRYQCKICDLWKCNSMYL